MNKKFLLHILKGYKKLKFKKKVETIFLTKISLVKKFPKIRSTNVSKKMFGAARRDANFILLGFMVYKTGYFQINQALLASYGLNKKLMYWFPASLLEILKKNKWKVSKNLSFILWLGFILFRYAEGLIFFGITVYKGIFKSNEIKKISDSEGIFVDNISTSEIPQSSRIKGLNLCTWLLKKRKKYPNIKYIAHNNKSLKQKRIGEVNLIYLDIFAPLKGFQKKFKFFLWGFKGAAFCTFELVLGRWWHALLFKEFLKGYIVKHAEYLPKEFLFHSAKNHKPLWVYEAEKRGSKGIYFFYSINNEARFKDVLPEEPIGSGWLNMRWRYYLVWDKYQKKFVQKCTKLKPVFEVSGPIWFSDSAENIPLISKNSIAVFDVQPRRKRYYAWLGLPFEYYTAKNSVEFFKNILSIAENSKIDVYWKEKRNIFSKKEYSLDPRYIYFLKKALNNKRLFLIRGGISPFRIIPKASAVVSMPFTSTALIARHFGKPSCYYDPTGIVQKNDRAAHGIPILSGKEELANWLFKNKISNKPTQGHLL